MLNRHNTTHSNEKLDLADFFANPKIKQQKQYEAIRAIVIDKSSTKSVGLKFNYKISTLHSMIRDAKNRRIELFPKIKKGPKRKQTNQKIQNIIIEFRKSNLSTTDIQIELNSQDISISARTVERILKEAGYEKLKRRTFAQLGKTVQNTLLSSKAEHINFDELEPFNIECPVAGVFLFITYII